MPQWFALVNAQLEKWRHQKGYCMYTTVYIFRKGKEKAGLHAIYSTCQEVAPWCSSCASIDELYQHTLQQTKETRSRLYRGKYVEVLHKENSISQHQMALMWECQSPELQQSKALHKPSHLHPLLWRGCKLCWRFSYKQNWAKCWRMLNLGAVNKCAPPRVFNFIAFAISNIKLYDWKWCIIFFLTISCETFTYCRPTFLSNQHFILIKVWYFYRTCFVLKESGLFFSYVLKVNWTKFDWIMSWLMSWRCIFFFVINIWTVCTTSVVCNTCLLPLMIEKKKSGIEWSSLPFTTNVWSLQKCTSIKQRRHVECVSGDFL